MKKEDPLKRVSNIPLEAWVNRLVSEEIPAFTHTARRLAALSKDSESSAADLAKVILSDPAMTAKVLRLVNSPAVNPSGRAIDTVSYAIVVLGYDKVRNLAVTASVLETAIPGQLIHQVKQEMACAYHAALQAQRIAELSGQKQTEDIYIAALLHRIGQIMFLSFPFEHQQAFCNLDDSPNPYEKLESDLLGFNFNELTQGLVERWKLSSLLIDAMNQKAAPDVKSTCIRHGYTIAECAKISWDTPDAARQVLALSAFIQKTPQETRKWLIQNAKDAEKQLGELGLDEGTQFISFPDAPKPSSKKVKSTSTPPNSQVTINKKITANKKATTNNVVGLFSKTPERTKKRAELHERLVAQLKKQLETDFNLDHFQVNMLESIRTGSSCDQTFIMLFKGKEQSLVCKHQLGQRSEQSVKRFQHLQQKSSSTFSKFFDANRPNIWRQSDKVLSISKDDITSQSFMTAPIKAFGKHLGYVVAVCDKNESISDADYELFSSIAELGCGAFRKFIERKS